MSAEYLKNAIDNRSTEILRKWYMGDSYEGSISDLVALIEQERKAAVEEYKKLQEFNDCYSNAPPKLSKKQLIIDLTKAALSGFCVNGVYVENSEIVDCAVRIAILTAEKLDKLEL